jgi:hypothetical protein
MYIKTAAGSIFALKGYTLGGCQTGAKSPSLYKLPYEKLVSSKINGQL